MFQEEIRYCAASESTDARLLHCQLTHVMFVLSVTQGKAYGASDFQHGGSGAGNLPPACWRSAAGCRKRKPSEPSKSNASFYFSNLVIK
jgi:hypothetical protein